VQQPAAVRASDRPRISSWRAAAAGVSISSALRRRTRRFRSIRFEAGVAWRKAKELTQESSSLGAGPARRPLEEADRSSCCLRQTQEAHLTGGARRAPSAGGRTQRRRSQRCRSTSAHPGAAHYYANMMPRASTRRGGAPRAPTAASTTCRGLRRHRDGCELPILAIVPDLQIAAPTTWAPPSAAKNLGAASLALSTFLAATAGIMQTTAVLAHTVGGYQQAARTTGRSRRFAIGAGRDRPAADRRADSARLSRQISWSTSDACGPLAGLLELCSSQVH